MAHKNTRLSHNKTSSSRSRPSRRSGFSAWINRFGRTNIIVVSIFVVAFAGLGSLLAYKSSAAACTSLHLYQGASGTCVSYAELMLYNSGTGVFPWAGFEPPCPALGSCTNGFHADGVFGYGMYLKVKSYQTSKVLPYRDGSIGYYTWKALCNDNKYHSWVYNNAGCMYIDY